jgi:hypothetical protein
MQTLQTANIRLTVSAPRHISPNDGRHWFPLLARLTNGSLLQYDTTVDDAHEALSQPNPVSGRVSDDAGETWREIAMPEQFTCPVAMPGGGMRSYSYTHWHRPDGSVYGLMADSPDGLAWSGTRPYALDIPATADLIPGVAAVVIHRSVLREPDGSLLASMYGRFKDDVKDRAWVARSDNEGQTWRYVSTIAYDPQARGEGFNETVLARVADGSLLAVMRTGSGTDFTLHQCRSLDGGRTWDAPRDLGVSSVEPDLCLMRNGVLACSFGRPIVNLMFSLDGSGRVWTEPVVIYDSPGNSTCYTALLEVSPGRLLLVYDTNGAGSPWQAHDNQVNAVLIDVEC